MFLSELKTTDLDKNQKYTFVVSLGATEQHGPFLPLGTDTYLHDAIVKKAEKNLSKIIFLPTIPISCSEEHKGFPGSIWIEKETMYLVLRDICDSLKEYAKHIIFISWHGGNFGLFNRFVSTEQINYKPIKLIHLEMGDEIANKKIQTLINGPIDEHAGNTEISMVLAANPKLVNKPNPKKHLKKNFNHDWGENHYMIESSPNGIADKHPKWVVNKKIGAACIDMHAKLLVREIRKIIKT